MTHMTGERTRAEHLEWCKARALEFVEAGDLRLAMKSFISDLGKHEETRSSTQIARGLGLNLAANGHLNTPEKMRKWIEDFK